MAMRDGRPTFSVLYAAGDSLSDHNNYIRLVTPPGQDSSLREAFGYSLSITNEQGDLDGDGRDEGTSFAQSLVDEWHIANSTVNVAVASSRSIGSRTLEEALRKSTGGDEVSLFDAIGDALPASRLARDINLTAQTDRIIADFEARGSPSNAAVTLLVGANDLSRVLAENADLAVDGLGASEVLALLPDALAVIDGIVDATVRNARRMAEAGIDNIVYLTSPVAYVPLANSAGEAVGQIADVVVGFLNVRLTAALEAADLFDRATDYLRVDAAALFQAVEDDPSSFNAVTFAAPYYAAGGPDAVEGLGGTVELVQPINPAFPFDGPDDRSFFFDTLHPNANAHDLLASFANASLTREVTFLDDRDNRFVDGVATDRNVVFAGAGDDTLALGGDSDVAFAGAGDDVVDGGSGHDILAGGSGDDVLDGGRVVRAFGVTLRGSGKDVLNGNDGDDTLFGGNNADLLIDGLGSDLLAGQKGRDILLHVDEALIGGDAGAADVDRLLGGKGFDTLALVLPDADDRALVVAASEGSRGADGSLGGFDIDALGLSVRGIERVLVFAERGLPDGLTDDARLAALLEEADLWSVALPALEGFDTADALYDSELFVV